MIDCKQIQALCDKYEDYLTPISIHVLRLRYNGKELLLPKAVGRILKISVERVRQLEERALKQLAYCQRCEAHGLPIVPIRFGRSFKQPVATNICSGHTGAVRSSWYTSYRGELLIHSPLTIDPLTAKNLYCYNLALAAYRVKDPADLPTGAIIGRALLTDCTPFWTGNAFTWLLNLTQQELFPEPIPYSGEPKGFYLPATVAATLPPRYPFSF